MTLRENLAARASPRSVIPWGAHGPTPGPCHISRHRPSEHSFLQHAPFLRATCAHLASRRSCLLLWVLWVSHAPRPHARYLDGISTVLDGTSLDVLMALSWYLDGISLVSRSVSRWYLDVLMALSPWLRLLRPPVAVHAEMAPSTATRLGSFIQGGDAILVSTQNCTRLLRLSPPRIPSPSSCAPTLPHSRCQSPQPVPVPTASDLTHTQAAILRILRQRSYAWAPA